MRPTQSVWPASFAMAIVGALIFIAGPLFGGKHLEWRTGDWIAAGAEGAVIGAVFGALFRWLAIRLRAGGAGSAG